MVSAEDIYGFCQRYLWLLPCVVDADCGIKRFLWLDGCDGFALVLLPTVTTKERTSFLSIKDSTVHFWTKILFNKS
jgi:hypothetical protein